MNVIVMIHPIRPLLAFASMGIAFALSGALEGYALLMSDGFQISSALSAAIALNGAIGLLAGILAALLLPKIVDAINPRQWYSQYLTDNDSKDIRSARIYWSSDVFSKLVALAVIGVWVGVFGGIAHSFNQRRLTMFFVSLGGITGLGVGWVFLINCRPLLVTLFNKFGRNARAIVLAPVIIVIFCIALITTQIVALDLGSSKTEHVIWPSLSMFLGLIIYVFILRAQRIIQQVCLTLGLLASCWTLVFLSIEDDWSYLANPILQRGSSTAVALTSLRYLADQDGDGAASAFAGGDCDDTNAKVGPHAKEIPGNGIDDNCRGGDAPPPKPLAVPTKEPKTDQMVAKPRAEPAITNRFQPQPYNIVYIFIDTLRADRLGMNGYTRPTSPNLDSFAKNALVFDQVYSQAPNTPRSFPSMITGRYPSRVKWVKRYANYGQLTDENETLFKIFGRSGWRTEMVSAHWYFTRAKGFEKGLHYWDNAGALSVRESNTQSAAPLITKKLMQRLDILEQQKQRFIILAHYFDPHSKYVSHRQFAAFGKKGLSNKYDGEIAFVDHHLKPVLQRLSTGLWAKNTVVVVTSDHGEAFKEHGFYFHGRTVYNEEIRIPLIIRIPGTQPQRIATAIAAIDLLPTLVELTGLKAPQAQGESLVGLWTKKGPTPTKPIFMEQLPYPNYKKHIVAGVDRKGQYKAIQNVTDNVLEVFDLVADPGEKVNLLDTTPGAGQKIRQALEQFIDGDPR